MTGDEPRAFSHLAAADPHTLLAEVERLRGLLIEAGGDRLAAEAEVERLRARVAELEANQLPDGGTWRTSRGHTHPDSAGPLRPSSNDQCS